MSLDPSAAVPPGDDAFVLTRVFAAPAAPVFTAWTDPAELLAWFGPVGFTMTAKTVDVRAGGTFHYAMQTPTGQTVWGRWIFREVAAPVRLVFVATFSDEAGGLTRNPWSSEWPAHVLTAVTFAEHGGRTTLTLHATPVEATPAEHAVFRAGHGPMHMGWGGTFNQLDEFLKKA